MSARVWEILLVEDDDDDLLFMQELLNDALGPDYALKWVKNPAELAQLDCQTRPDVAILDYRFDAQSASELVQKVHAGCPGLALIFITEWPLPDEAGLAAQQACFVLMKANLTCQVLAQAIADAVGQD